MTAPALTNPDPAYYRVTITVDPADVDSVVDRNSLLLGTFFRLVQVTRLLRVETANFLNGCMILLVENDPVQPALPDGRVHIDIRRLKEEAA